MPIRTTKSKRISEDHLQYERDPKYTRSRESFFEIDGIDALCDKNIADGKGDVETNPARMHSQLIFAIPLAAL